ncbi:MAG: ABC transporter ATP-binding protein [Geminicoccaceae bacterium]|nr:ABC transporter ATP-binding protein [Geminicoccaceae bacterium]MCS7267975.1 ABC transporter ATP-binding protein [Geminicoccaceae bacterium]MCX7629856.1 ABC transporter ATP-binding protein [Geminicoccaceae bacterium]MDW8124111.1 ABC transporter ATP-binding protein [Geminicoccaceae bacterium]MDW8340226.1 ABC transporter ATP-binding protein [Geminicoccaceae bacterium]
MKELLVERLSKIYFDPDRGERIAALEEVSLRIAPGEFVAVVGPSGCGKSTLLNLIAGFLEPTSGRILLDGRPVRGPGPDRGVVFQSYALFPWKTVLENVAFGPRMRGLPKAECHAKAMRYLELVGLAHVAHRYPRELSGGMQQRVGVVRALANEPEILLMDEPFAAVDAQTRMTLQEELARIYEERRPTILFVTHDVNEAVFLADRVLLLSKGRLREEIPVPIARPRRWPRLVEDDDFKALVARTLSAVRAA